MGMGAVDDTIRLQLVVETQKAIADMVQFEAQVAATKQQMLDLAQQSGAAFATVAKQMRSQKYNELLSDHNVRSTNPTTGKTTVDKDALAQAKAEYKTYSESVRVALQSIVADERTTAKQREAIVKQLMQEIEQAERKNAAVLRSIEQDAAKEDERLLTQRSEARAKADKAEAQRMLKDQKDVAALRAKRIADQQKLDFDIATLMQKKGGSLDPLANIQDSKQRIATLVQEMETLRATSNATFKEIAEGMKQAFNQKVLEGVKTIPQLKQAKVQMDAFSKQVDTAMRQANKSFDDGTKSATGLDKELKQKPKDAGAVQSAFSKLGAVASYVFGTVLGLSAIQVLRDIVRWFKAAEQVGEEYMQSLYRLTTSVHALQRVGFDITIKDTADLIDKLGKKFTMFTNKQLVDGIGQVQLLTRSFGFSKDQMQQVFEIATTLSVVLGKDFNDSAREVALFLSSGYAESMQKAGLAVNKFMVEQEGARLGLGKNYRAMTEHGRATAALSLVYREIGPLMGDVNEYQKTQIGQIKDITSDFDDMTNSIGTRLVPVKLLFLKVLLKVIDVWGMLNSAVAKTAGNLANLFAYPFILAIDVMDAWKKSLSGVPFDFDKVSKDVAKQVTELSKQVEESLTIIKQPDLKDLLRKDLPANERGTMPLLSEGDADTQVKIIEKMYKEADKLKRDYEKDFAKAGQDLQNDLGTAIPDPKADLDYLLQTWDEFYKDQSNLSVDAEEAMQTQWEGQYGKLGDILDKGLAKALDIWQAYYNKLDDIARKEQESIADENREYGQRIEDANREANQSIEDANRKHREEEIKAERDYQEKLRRLREQYLFDLEDALRERDALQVLRLMRKYQMDKSQIERDNDAEKKARDEDFKREIEDIQRQRERKLAELKIEHERRLQEIAIQANREREEAARNRDQAMADLEAELEAERATRQTKYAQEIADLHQRFSDRLTEVFIGLTDEEGVTKDLLDAIGVLYLNMFGPAGLVDMSYQNLQVMVQNSVAQAQAAYDQLQVIATQAAATAASLATQAAAAGSTSSTTGSGTSANSGNWTPQSPGGHALGGTEYVNKPTVALFGEAGPEVVTFTPINRMNTNNMGLPNPFYGAGGGQGGKMSVLIRLSPGLVAEIVDQSMGEVAKIIEDQA